VRAAREGTTAIGRWARAHQAILAFLLAVFILRIYLAGWNSYWSDELLSVLVFGVWNDSALSAVVNLAENSIHPPLYQFVLYLWMSVFGDTETATRTLSNLYITGAALAMYFFVRISWTKRIAFVAAALFAVMALPTYYALETRSYAQTMFLVTLSSFFMARVLFRMRTSRDWSIRPHRAFLLGFALANTALMLTHYYNLFWLFAQALFVAVFVLVEMPREKLLRGVLSFGALCILPVLAFLAIWGTVFFRQYANTSEGFAVEGGAASLTPLDLLWGSVLEPSASVSKWIWLVVGALVAAVAVVAILRVVRGRRTDNSSAAWSYLYLAFWLIAPLLVVYLTFTAAGVERYSARYFLFVVPALGSLVVIALAVLINRSWAKTVDGRMSGIALSLVGALVFVLFVPTAEDAATSTKHDWRGITQDVVETVKSNPEYDFTIIETAHGSTSRGNYYFERFDREIRTDFNVRRSDEQDADFSIVEREIGDPAPGERYIVLLYHSRAIHFPKFLAYMEATYGKVHAQLDRQGRGYIVYGSP